MSKTAPGRPARGTKASRSPASQLVLLLCGLGGALLLLVVATVPLQPRQQAILAIVSAAVFLVANRFAGRGVSVFLVVLSLATSLRYIVWRLTDTLDFGSFAELVLGVMLALAECYAITVLVLGYIQTLWPLDRKPMPLPDDPALWPSVDVFIPTYNEPLEVVRATVLGAAAMDWPPDRLRIYLLDDGKRVAFQDFAAECGVGYITRADNRHAKAGNLNNALAQTTGAFVAVFDCDHVPTRAFLQMTMGWMVAEPRCALVQTPHHFYSPDPFQRNLSAGTRVPAEGNMFYGLIQDANDYWNATFFCGSCAVLRRSALDQIGGFATETVTEDAHTMLKLHRRGWDSCYLRLPLAAGLATERLIQHIGQRVRWARGMIQIFRIDNPLLGPGLSFGQRVCYLQAMGHFFFAMPRVVFLAAPLAFLLLGLNVIAASPLAIVSYALPHIFHSVATNSRLQQNHRHSFWSEIYETVLALFLIRVTAATLVAPRRGRFNVTTKGGLLENGFFDLAAVYPNLILAVLLIAGLLRGVYGMTFLHPDRLTFQALLLNSIWGSFSLLTVMAALAVGRETRQVHARPRVRAVEPVTIHLPDGRSVAGMTQYLSQSGGAVLADRPPGVQDGAPVEIEMLAGEGAVVIPARLRVWDRGGAELAFEPATITDEAAIVRAVFGRADAWTEWSAYPVDRPLTSLLRVLQSIRGLFRPPDRAQRSPASSGPTSSGSSGAGAEAVDSERVPIAPRRRHLAGTAAAILLLLLPVAAQAQLASGQTGQVQSGGYAIRPAPPLPAALTDNPPPLPDMPPANPAPAPPLAPASFVPSPAPAVQSRTIVLTLHQLGANVPLTLRGTSELQGVQFGIRADEVVTAATLDLSGAMSPALIPEFSNVTLTLNEQYAGTIPVTAGQPRFEHLAMPIDPVFFQDNNRLNFRFSGRYTRECNDPLSGLLWATVSDTSTLTLTLARLPPQRDLARLPLPFFDAHEKTGLSLPFILPANPSDQSLTAAGIVASWFGQLADYRGADFPVAAGAPMHGNAVLIVTGMDRPPGIALPPLNGPTLAVIPSPNDPAASILLVAGRTGQEALAAATTLTLGSGVLSGTTATVSAPDVPFRHPYDAPAWIPDSRPVKLGELVDAAALEGTGYVPGTMQVPFRTAPDLYTARGRGFPLRVGWRAPPGPIEDLRVSRLDVGINEQFLASLPLDQGAAGGSSWLSRLFNFGVTPSTSRVDIPAYNVFGQNDLQFFFDTRPLRRGDCVAVPQDLRMGVDPDSTVDISGAYRFTQLPNLAYFTSAGFPFTRLADLSDTAVVLPVQPDAVELGAYLDMMGRFGFLTGYPAIRVAVTRPEGVGSMADRNLLLLGTLQRLGPAAGLLQRSPYRFDGNRLQVDLAGGPGVLGRLFSGGEPTARDRAAAVLNAAVTDESAAIVGAQSPLNAGRSVVALVGGAPSAVLALVTALHDPEQAPGIQGDLALLGGGKVSSYRIGPLYTVGSLPFWLYPAWLLQDQPIGLVALMLLGCVLLAVVCFVALRRRAALRSSRVPAGPG